jgi:hypothetical protein
MPVACLEPPAGLGATQEGALSSYEDFMAAASPANLRQQGQQGPQIQFESMDGMVGNYEFLGMCSLGGEESGSAAASQVRSFGRFCVCSCSAPVFGHVARLWDEVGPSSVCRRGLVVHVQLLPCKHSIKMKGGSAGAWLHCCRR